MKKPISILSSLFLFILIPLPLVGCVNKMSPINSEIIEYQIEVKNLKDMFNELNSKYEKNYREIKRLNCVIAKMDLTINKILLETGTKNDSSEGK